MEEHIVNRAGGADPEMNGKTGFGSLRDRRFTVNSLFERIGDKEMDV